MSWRDGNGPYIDFGVAVLLIHLSKLITRAFKKGEFCFRYITPHPPSLPECRNSGTEKVEHRMVMLSHCPGDIREKT